MSARVCPRPVAIVLRWILGTALISWRYLWQIIPLYRFECAGSIPRDGPPSLPVNVVDDTLQFADDGVGPLFHRRFRVRIAGASAGVEELMTEVRRDFKRFVPSEVIEIGRHGETGDLAVGNEFVIEMPGPWNGPVRVVHLDRSCLRLATLQGHLEAGQVQFGAWNDDGTLVFEIEAWARPGSKLVDLLYTNLRLAKEIQLNMWVRFCRKAATTAGGHPDDGISIHTDRVETAVYGDKADAFARLSALQGSP